MRISAVSRLSCRCLALLLSLSSLVAGEEIECAVIGSGKDLSTVGYVTHVATCPRSQFCCYPVSGGGVAICCPDCVRDVDFNPVMRPADCLADQLDYPAYLLPLLPLGVAALPPLIAGSSLLVLTMVRKKPNRG